MIEVGCLGEYRQVRRLCKAVKEGDTDALDLAAALLAVRIPKTAVLVPVPGRFGRAVYTLSMAVRIAYLNGCRVENCLGGETRDSLCDLKHDGKETTEPVFKRKWNIPAGEDYVLLDNVCDTGTTMKAAAKALGRKCRGIVIGGVYERRNKRERK